ncbi:MAG: OmpA family protein [Dermatophilaceae bacterium]
MRRRTVFSGCGVVSLGFFATVLVGAPAAAAPSAQTDPRDAKVVVEDVPVLGQTLISVSQQAGRGDVVASVHGVRRVPKGTVLYWSVGVPNSAAKDGLSGGTGLWPNWFAYDRYGTKGEPRNVSVIDAVGRKVYEPLITDKDEACICSKSKTLTGNKGEVNVLFAVVPELPAGVTTVDVKLGFGSIVQGVPVEDGVLEPAAPAEERTIQLGQEWPEIDLAAVASSFEPQKAIYPLTTRQGSQDGALTQERQSAKVTLNLSADVLFAVDQATITPRAAAVIADAARSINTSAKAGDTVTIAGHTDSDASPNYNQALSQRRAQAVLTALKPRLTVQVRLIAQGKGENVPVASNKTPKGKALNRRVSIDFVPKGP